jgi:Ferritin-like domain
MPGRALAGTPSDNDLAWARLLVVAELLAIDFYERSLRSRQTQPRELRRALADERRHHETVAEFLTAAGQVPPGPGDVDFVYPKHAFSSRRSLVELGARLESVFLGAYLGAVGGLDDDSLKLRAARAAASEAQHLSAFTNRIGPAFPRPLPIERASEALDTYTG